MSSQTLANTPKHIAVILDGNRRFAKRLMLEPWKGHEYGTKKVEQLISWCIEQHIRELTLYAFSMQNFARPKEEFNYLMKLIEEAFEKFSKDARIEKHNIRINILGRYKLFPKPVVDIFEKVMARTRDNDGFIINFAMAYGGREEIVDAVKAMLSDSSIRPQDIDETLISQYLYTASEPDIIVRTGGEKRTSNFLPWQAVYSELFFIDKSWPEFEKEDFLKILEEYAMRERRFGK